MTDAVEPSTKSRHIAFQILTRHGDCLIDDVSLNDLIDDIAKAIDAVESLGEIHQKPEGEQ